MPVRPTTAIFAAVLGLAFFIARPAAAQNDLPTFAAPAAYHTQVKLILSADTAKPGDTIWAGVDLKMEPGWHTYWKNPGDAGSPTKIEWTLPPGISAGEILWPLPEKLPPAEVTTYGYEDEVMLLVPLKIETNLPAGVLNLAAKVSWLECKDVCIPANQNVEAKLKIGKDWEFSANTKLILSLLAKMPPTLDSKKTPRSE